MDCMGIGLQERLAHHRFGPKPVVSRPRQQKTYRHVEHFLDAGGSAIHEYGRLYVCGGITSIQKVSKAANMSTKMDRYHILHLINTSQYPSTERLCDHWEVSERTIHGDISFLKDFMNQPIKYDRNRGGYYTDEPNKPLPAVDLTDEELLALAVGKDIIARYSGGALTAPITSALDKISLRCKEKQEEASSIPLKFKGSLTRPLSRKLVEALQECIEKCFVLEIDYYPACTNQRERRRINPHVIYESMGSLYVLAWCELRKDFRQFALHRVREFKVLRTPFQKQNSADLEKWLASTLQTEIRHPEEVVKLRFAADAAPYVSSLHVLCVDEDFDECQPIAVAGPIARASGAELVLVQPVAQAPGMFTAIDR